MARELRDKLKSEVMAVTWPELVLHFARGALLLLSPQVDLLEVAVAVAQDDRTRVERWLHEGALWRATDADARVFTQHERTRFQFVIVQPWVLAQALSAPSD